MRHNELSDPVRGTRGLQRRDGRVRCSTCFDAAWSSSQPILILLPIGVDNTLLLLWWKRSRTRHSLKISGILRRGKHITVIALSTLNLVAKALDAARCELEGGDPNAVRLTLPTLPSILAKHGKSLRDAVSREIASDNPLDICA